MGKASVYGIYGLAFLCRQPEGKFIPLFKLSPMIDAPNKSLAKIFQDLVRSGIVKSHRGVKGGFCINKSKQGTTLREIIESVQSPIQISRCLNNKNKHSGITAEKLRTFCQEIQMELDEKLESKTLADLI